MKTVELLDRLDDIKALAKCAEIATSEFIADYGFAKKPDPQKALACLTGKSSTIESIQSFKWYSEYERIFTLIEIADDYICKILNLTNTVDSSCEQR